MKNQFKLMHVGSSEFIATAKIIQDSHVVIEYEGDDDGALKVILPNKDLKKFALAILQKPKHYIGWEEHIKQFEKLNEIWHSIPEPTKTLLRQQIDFFANPNKE